MIEINGYSDRKARSADMADYIGSVVLPESPQYKKLHHNIRHCASQLVFHDYYTIDKHCLVGAITCKKHLLCPFCAVRRGSKMIEKNLPRVDQAMKDDPHLVPVLVTLTVMNGDDLRERFNHLTRSLRELNRRRRNCLQGQKWTEWARVAGAVRAIEVTNKGQGWHPHAHILCLVDSWIDRDALQDEWHSITRDSYIVDVRRIKPKNTETGGLSIQDGLGEVFKYAVKFSDMAEDLTWHAYETLRGKRLVDSFGVLRGIEVPDSLTDDPLEGLPYMELFYQYMPHKRSYELTGAKPHDPT